MGVDRQGPADYVSRTSEGELSLDSEQALPSASDGGVTSHRVPGAGRPRQAAGLREAALLNGSGSYELPTPATINAEAAGFASTTPVNGTISLIDGSAAGAYPIVNCEYAIISTRQPSTTRANDLKALLNWILTTGSSSTYLTHGGFQPLPPQVAPISHALAAEISS
jgi:phosphate transport system substrate-binding protein